MSDYFETKNFENIDNILRKRFKETDISKAEAVAAANTKYLPSQSKIIHDLAETIRWCERSIKEYISINKAVGKGEIALIGSLFLSMSTWRFSQYILDRKIMIDSELLDIKSDLLKENIYSERICILLQNYNPVRSLIFKDVNNAQQIIWYEGRNQEDIKNAQKYLLTLTEKKFNSSRDANEKTASNKTYKPTLVKPKQESALRKIPAKSYNTVLTDSPKH